MLLIPYYPFSQNPQLLKVFLAGDGRHPGFSQTSSQVGFLQSVGLLHFQSHTGSLQTALQTEFGDYQVYYLKCFSLITLTKLLGKW
jgi:hypothetical protein